jgi:hypothetical protein
MESRADAVQFLQILTVSRDAGLKSNEDYVLLMLLVVQLTSRRGWHRDRDVIVPPPSWEGRYDRVHETSESGFFNIRSRKTHLRLDLYTSHFGTAPRINLER